MTPLVVAEVVLALIVLVIVGALTFVWARRRYISGDGRPVMLCARRDGEGDRWRLGLARLSSDRFEWFSIVGPSLRPEVGVRVQKETAGQQQPWLATSPIEGQFAFVPAAYTAVRAWLESSPPGYKANVA